MSWVQVPPGPPKRLCLNSSNARSFCYTDVMIIENANTLLYIEPLNQKSDSPVIDSLTKKMTAAFQNKKSTGVLLRDGTFNEGSSTMGFQRCACQATSDPVDYELTSGFITNSLCVHYLGWHRAEIPESELQKVESLPDEEIDPTADLLK